MSDVVIIAKSATLAPLESTHANWMTKMNLEDLIEIGVIVFISAVVLMALVGDF